MTLPEVIHGKGDHSDAMMIVLRGCVGVCVGDECLASHGIAATGSQRIRTRKFELDRLKARNPRYFLIFHDLSIIIIIIITITIIDPTMIKNVLQYSVPQEIQWHLFSDPSAELRCIMQLRTLGLPVAGVGSKDIWGFPKICRQLPILC